MVGEFGHTHVLKVYNLFRYSITAQFVCLYSSTIVTVENINKTMFILLLSSPSKKREWLLILILHQTITTSNCPLCVRVVLLLYCLFWSTNQLFGVRFAGQLNTIFIILCLIWITTSGCLVPCFLCWKNHRIDDNEKLWRLHLR